MKIMPEDLMEMVIAADTVRRRLVKERVSFYPRWKRTWIEPVFNVFGLLIGQALASLPWVLRWRADQRINYWLGGRASAQSPDFEARCNDLAVLAQRLHQETGQWPATLIFTSHPLTSGPLEWLRFEVVREGLMLANRIVDISQTGLYRSAPQCFLAIDPYALDTIPTPVAGFYAGMMYRIYIAWDRMSRTQGALQRHVLLRKTGYAHIAGRLLRRLKNGVPVVMVLPGGLPFNARLLYAAREFVHRLGAGRWPYAKRLAQRKWMEALMHPVENDLPLLKGELPETTRQVLQGLLRDWKIPEDDHRRLLAAFAQEFKLAVPYRERLFRVLFNRLVAKGKPLLWAAVVHGEKTPTVRVSLPWGAYRTPQGELRFIRGPEGRSEPLTNTAQVAMDFSQEFVV